MICLFTQTYGDARSELFDWKIKDSNLNFFIQQFDHSILSFHNSSENFRKSILQKYPIYKENMVFDGISYPECLKRIITFVKNNNFTKFIFLQDDVFSVQKDIEHYKALADYIKNASYDMINLEVEGNETIFPVFEKTEDFSVFSTNNHDLKKIDPNCWNFDDATYATSVKFLDEIYDNEYFNHQNIWIAEHFLNMKMRFKTIPRYILSKTSFMRCNLLGPNNNRNHTLSWLKDRFENNS